MIPLWLLSLGKGAMGLITAIPVKVWIALGVLLLVWAAAMWQRREGAAERDVYWRGVRAEEARAAERLIAELRGEIADWVLKGIKDRDEAARKARERELAYEAKVEELNKRRVTYVTQVANARCDLTRGVVLAFNADAGAANGQPAAAAPADTGAEVVDAPAGISLTQYTEAVAATQQALGKCRLQVLGWQEHWKLTTEWYEGLRARARAAP